MVKGAGARGGWEGGVRQEKIFVEEAIGMVLELEFSNDEVSILIPKSIT